MNSVNPAHPSIMLIPKAGGFASARQRTVSAVREVVSKSAYIPLEYHDGLWEAGSKRVRSADRGLHSHGASAGIYGSNGVYVADSVRKAQFVDIYL